MSNKNFKKHQGIGISININENYGDFFTGLEFFLKAVIEQKFNVVELYNSGIIKNEKDIQKLIKLIK